MEECRKRTPLSRQEAFYTLEPYFEETREVFLERGLVLLAKVKLSIQPWVHDAPRHFAACSEDGQSIVLAPQMATLDPENVAAILAHEFGHATDFSYPARFQMADGELLQLQGLEVDRYVDAEGAPIRGLDVRPEFNRMRRWHERDDDTVEVTADAVASWATGREIAYGGPCMLQQYEPGQPRPRGLR